MKINFIVKFIWLATIIILVTYTKTILALRSDVDEYDDPPRGRSNRTQVVQIFKSSDVRYENLSNVTSAIIPVKRLTFVVLLTGTIKSNENDCIMPKVLPTIDLAIRDVQKMGFVGVNFDVTLVSRDTFCSSTYGAIGFYEIYSQFHEINAIFGLSCDYILAPISRYSSVWEIPVLSTSGRSIAFDDKASSYSTLIRMMGGVGAIGESMKGLINSFNWTRSAFIVQNLDENMGNSICFLCIVSVDQIIGNRAVKSFKFSDMPISKQDAIDALLRISKSARIVIMCADPKSIRQIMLSAEELNMIDNGEYVFINIELFSKVPHVASKPWYDPNDTVENNAKAKNAYTALLTVTPEQPSDETYLNISEEIKTLAYEKYNYSFINDEEPLSTFVTSFYDGVLLYAMALNESIKEDPTVLTRPINGTDMVRRMWNRTFTGITGNVTIDANGDRVSTYSLLDLNPETGKFEIVARLIKNQLNYLPNKTIHWAGGRTEPPPEVPTCGFDGSLCPDDSLPGYAILSIVLGFTVVFMAIGSFVGYRHYKSEAEINSMSWKISYDEVTIPESIFKTFRGSIHSLVKRHSQFTLISEDMGSLGGEGQIFIPVGVYKGSRVAIKPISENSINMNRALMLKLKRMKDIQHENLVKFYGACLEGPRCFVLTEYCQKGSLQEILENDQIQLDWMFKLSLMHDIVRGMHFLHHSDIKSHGNLKSSNCVVDSRFNLKITDFGLPDLKKPDLDNDEENCNSYAYWKKLLWTAPELLKMHDRPLEGTQKADIYSFGIIVHEITTREGPFYLGIQGDKSPQEIIHLVKGYPETLPHPFRPVIEDTTTEDLKNIMTKCWAQDPNERPDFHSLKTVIRKINKNNETGNIVDNLLQRMEQYANNLEDVVQERTQDYLEEKKKCEQLLYQLLPQSVAAQLISGQPVVAETFDQVTIYFSDIVGFTAISAESTPMEVVKFLNDLYTCFDSIVENFDVYKVETIGDAYMVVSGLPVRNENLHAREIARLAIALLNAVYSFKIHHRPNDQLKLRIGLHSGPCVAGVVGLKMPRYCLFGDTVNTASRMESNGEALKIHISQNTKDYLDEFGSFITTQRGYVKMKGKGEQLTYWLDGEHDTSPSLHELSISPKASQQKLNHTPHPHIRQSPSPSPIFMNLSKTLKNQRISSSTPKLNGEFKTDDNYHHHPNITNAKADDYHMNVRPPLPLQPLLTQHPPHHSHTIASEQTNNCIKLINLKNSFSDTRPLDCSSSSNSLFNSHNNDVTNNFSQIVKKNNLKNLKIICNSSSNDDSVKNNGSSVTQPLLATINS